MARPQANATQAGLSGHFAAIQNRPKRFLAVVLGGKLIKQPSAASILLLNTPDSEFMKTLADVIKNLTDTQPELTFWQPVVDKTDSIDSVPQRVIANMLRSQISDSSWVADMLGGVTEDVTGEPYSKNGITQDTFADLVKSAQNYMNFSARQRVKLIVDSSEYGRLLIKWWRQEVGKRKPANEQVLQILLRRLEKQLQPPAASLRPGDWLELLSESSTLVQSQEDAKVESSATPNGPSGGLWAQLTRPEKPQIVDFKQLTNALDQFLGLTTRDASSHGKQTRAGLDFAEFRSQFLAVLVLAEQIAVRLIAEFPGSTPLSRVMWLLRCYFDESTNTLANLGEWKNEFESNTTVLGVGFAFETEGTLLQQVNSNEQLDAYLNPFDSEALVGAAMPERHSYLAARIAIAAIAYKALSQLCGGTSPFPSYVMEILWRRKEASEDVRNRLDTTDPRNSLPLLRCFLKKMPSKDCATEYNSADEWLRHHSRKGKVISLAVSQKGLPNRIDREFVHAVFDRLIHEGLYANHAIVAVASKLGVFYKGIFEPSCSIPHKPATKSGATQVVANIKNLVAMVNSSINGKSMAPLESALVSMAHAIYFTDKSENELNNGFVWASCGGDRSSTKSDSHIGQDGPHPFLRLFGDCFQKSVDEAIATSALAWEKSRGVSYRGEGDRFARFLLLAPQCDPKSSDVRRKTLQDWPGWLSMRVALLSLVQRPEDRVALNSRLFLPVIKPQKYRQGLATYFDSAQLE